ncbi:hypothetical protein [Thiocapsa rosea]|uniref:Uncharacterized protein n=1 Tax=Thiocapsa rosea TaxID=69360 RepID=A0A495V1F0_9GAMM|nr:hypothetical protein [Thiocapsa rosea]RKT43109.1 hypothetical protein BDD21_0419 [Thiocapsa rosea]
MSEQPATPNAGPPMRDWDNLGAEEQTALLIEYGYHLEQLPPTCDLRTKVERLREWLQGRGIRYSRKA